MTIPMRASKLGTGVARTGIAQVTSDMIQRAIEAISLPAPFDELLKQNIADNAFAGLNLSTVGEYVEPYDCHGRGGRA